jgi:hypothetical protein
VTVARENAFLAHVEKRELAAVVEHAAKLDGGDRGWCHEVIAI